MQSDPAGEGALDAKKFHVQRKIKLHLLGNVIFAKHKRQ